MIERAIAVATRDGVMPTFSVAPERHGPHPAVIFYMDALGIREELRAMARRIACVGYHVVVPDLFHRDGGPSFRELIDDDDPGDPRMAHLNTATTLAMVRADSAALRAWLARDPATKAGAKAAIGYCMGARHALACAADAPGEVVAFAAFHGGRMATDQPDSPHLLAHRVTGEAYVAVAENDPAAPAEAMATLKRELDRSGAVVEMETHRAKHGFTFPGRYCHDRAAADRAWERLFALLRRQLT